MLDKLQRRAVKYGVSSIINTIQAGENYNAIDLHETLDFALLFAVVHEVPDKVGLFRDMFAMLKTGGKILFTEPKGHVKPADFEKSIQLAKTAGFSVLEEKPVSKGLCVFLIKNPKS
jgi:SAM-dependent methyltransferase